MKKIKTVNGYAIYQAVSARDAENYSCAVGSYNLYLATDVRDYGLANSSPEFEDIDSLAAALELANGSNHAIAEALAEELGRSTCIDMDLVLEIERRLDAGEDQEAIREELEPCVLDEDDENDTGDVQIELKAHLFAHAKAELDACTRISKILGDEDPAVKARHSCFCAVWAIIEDAGLVDEYQAWKEAQA